MKSLEEIFKGFLKDENFKNFWKISKNLSLTDSLMSRLKESILRVSIKLQFDCNYKNKRFLCLYFPTVIHKLHNQRGVCKSTQQLTLLNESGISNQ